MENIINYIPKIWESIVKIGEEVELLMVGKRKL